MPWRWPFSDHHDLSTRLVSASRAARSSNPSGTADGLDGGQIEAAGEHAQAIEQHLLVGGEQAVGPVQRGRPACGGGPFPLGRPRAAAETGHPGGPRPRPALIARTLPRGQLDRQGIPSRRGQMAESTVRSSSGVNEASARGRGSTNSSHALGVGIQERTRHTCSRGRPDGSATVASDGDRRAARLRRPPPDSDASRTCSQLSRITSVERPSTRRRSTRSASGPGWTGSTTWPPPRRPASPGLHRAGQLTPPHPSGNSLANSAAVSIAMPRLAHATDPGEGHQALAPHHRGEPLQLASARRTTVAARQVAPVASTAQRREHRGARPGTTRSHGEGPVKRCSPRSSSRPRHSFRRHGRDKDLAAVPAP